jgi:copper chaperone CopZ
MRQKAILGGLGLVFVSVVLAQIKPTKVYVGVVGMSCPVCTSKLREVLGGIQGVKYEFIDDFGDTSFVALEIADIGKTDVGAIAKTLADADTPHKDDHRSGLFLLPWKEQETSTESVRNALAKIKGVDVKRTRNGDARVWIRLDDSGQAKLAAIAKALDDAGIKVAFDKSK